MDQQSFGTSDSKIFPYSHQSTLPSYDANFIIHHETPSTSIPRPTKPDNHPIPNPVQSETEHLHPGQIPRETLLPDSPTALEHLFLQSPDLQFLHPIVNRLNPLRYSLYSPSGPSAIAPLKTRSLTSYAQSRGANDGVGMRKTNEEDLRTGQVWRPVTVFVEKDLLKLSEEERKQYGKKLRKTPGSLNTRVPYVIQPAALHAGSRIVWRDVYDHQAMMTDRMSCSTALEMAVAGRMAYNWLSRRHRTVISSDTVGYLKAMVRVGQTGQSVTYKSCKIETLPLCAREYAKQIGNESFDVHADVDVILQWFALLLYESTDDMPVSLRPAVEFENDSKTVSSVSSRSTSQTSSNRKQRHQFIDMDCGKVIFDHANRMALLHVRGSWGGDVKFSHKESRRRSELLNYVSHNSMMVIFGEVRTCPCVMETTLTSLALVRVKTQHVQEADIILRNPGLVYFPFGFVVFVIYITVFFVAVLFILISTFNDTESSSLQLWHGTLEGVSLSFALVTAAHYAVTRNVWPGVEFRQLAQRLRFSTDLDDVNPSSGALICISHDERANLLLAPGGASALAHRPNGPVCIPSPPSATTARALGVLATTNFAIKIEQGTPLICYTIRNLDGSVHVDWDSPVTGPVVGQLLGSDVRVA